MAKKIRKIAMPRKQQEPWFQPADFLRIGIPVAALAAGFYFTTNARLSESDKSFELINKRFETVITSVEEVKKKTIETGNKDAEGRSKVRDEFIKAQNETNQSLARVDTKLAVAETK